MTRTTTYPAVQAPAESSLIDRARLAATDTLTALIDGRDAETGRHSRRVAELAREIATSLGWGPRRTHDVYLAGRLHDVGKIAIPDSILRKRTELTAEEWRVIRRHPVVGANLVLLMPELADLAPFIGTHHEWYDGGGYPYGLRGESIPFEARVLAVADAFDAMTSDRAYRPRLSVTEARARLREGAAGQFDPQAVVALDACLDAGAGSLTDDGPAR